jgi:glutamate-ammonia-ligase adenylyltransferase
MGAPLPAYFADAFTDNPDPDLALTNLERWLGATGNPSVYLEQIAGAPALGRQLIMILGASQPLADSLIQNPELASLVFEPGRLSIPPTAEQVLADGRRLLRGTTSFTHALDRLRYVRQRWTLPIVLNDLGGGWPQEQVWRALSAVADALISLARDAVWEETRTRRELPPECPVLVVGYGKLGGEELNYSSDVDLVYVGMDDMDEPLSRSASRSCEALGRALSERMGRGSLYRVDLRLRPYGGTGPILPSMRAVEAYYNLYAEHWEVQALLRSRPIAGPEPLMRRWEAMRVRTCFRPRLTEMAIDEMLAMRARIEEGAAADDLKRGPGGIRDVEFLVQVLQLLHGHDHPALQLRPTCDAIRALDSAGFMEHPVADALLDAYTFLRKLEHRAQLVGDRQTHRIPASAEGREQIARSMGAEQWAQAASALETHRRTIQSLYRSSLSLDPATDALSGASRDAVAREMEAQGPAALQWFDVLPESGRFYEVLAKEPACLERIRTILLRAPRLVSTFKASVPLTELLLSGEIESVDDPVQRIAGLPTDLPLSNLADHYRSGATSLLAQWSLAPTAGQPSPFDLGERLAALTEAMLLHCLHRLYADFDVVATGSFGSYEPGPGSDADLILLVKDRERHAGAEQQAQDLLDLVGRLKRFGAPLSLDLRLRPEGRKGLLVRTYEGFRSYDFEGMEMWERFALGNARLIAGNPEALGVVRHSAYGLPLSPERLRELMRMKRRVETERVKPQHVHRDVKLGSGGLSDIEWFVHLHEMRYPEATLAANGELPLMDERIRRIARVGLINAVEAETLQEARRYLADLRSRIYLQGLSDDLMPENPDRLDRLAEGFGLAGANELLARHRTVTEFVRRLFLDAVDRLRP